ncbi:hypothetical protein QJ48_25535 [Paenibacillus sp. A3]|nr:hypothetical protein QJ48_25535 [Paenibacillus sp. A3]
MTSNGKIQYEIKLFLDPEKVLNGVRELQPDKLSGVTFSEYKQWKIHFLETSDRELSNNGWILRLLHILESRPADGSNTVLVGHDFTFGDAFPGLPYLGMVILEPGGQGKGYRFLSMICLEQLVGRTSSGASADLIQKTKRRNRECQTSALFRLRSNLRPLPQMKFRKA